MDEEIAVQSVDTDGNADSAVTPSAPGSVFIESVRRLTADEIAPKPPKKPLTLQDLLDRAARPMALLLCAAVVCVSMWYVAQTLYNYKRAVDIYDGISNVIDGIDNEHSGAVAQAYQIAKAIITPDFKTSLTMTEEDYRKLEDSTAVNARFEQIKSKLSFLKQKNSDLYGWIKIAGTNIDYPVVQYTDNDYYLNTAFTGEYLPAGTVFADYRCDESIIRNYNTIFYGHHMGNGTMFNNLDNYFSEEYFYANRYIEIYTFEGIYTYEVFSVYQTNMYYKYIRTAFVSGNDFIEFANEMKDNSIFPTETGFNANDRMITLSTCTNLVQNGRISLQAKLIKVEN